MTWLHIEQEMAFRCDLESVEQAIEKQKQVLEYLYIQRNELMTKIRHLRYRQQMERPTNVTVETKGEIS